MRRYLSPAFEVAFWILLGILMIFSALLFALVYGVFGLGAVLWLLQLVGELFGGHGPI